MDKIQLKPVDTQMILTKEEILSLNELLIFPHGMDGLHIWEAGIILARWIVFNKELFLGKDVLELGTGVGIGGLSAAKFTQCNSIVMSDYKKEIVDNIEKNIVKNLNKNQKICCVIKLDWIEYQNFNKTFDLIIGSDLIYAGAPVNELYQLIKKGLKQGGKAYIMIPSKRHYAEKFLEIVNKDNIFQYKIEQLNDQRYLQCPLLNEKEGFRVYSGLKELEFYIYEFTRIEV